MMIVLFTLGLEGASFASLAVATIAIWATIHGHGPAWLMPDSTPMRRTLMLQLFLGSVVAVALPVGALLDERIHAERAAREGQSIYRILIENSEDMIVLSGLDGTRRFVSPAVQSMTGWTPEEFLTIKPMDNIHPDDRDLGQTILASLANGTMNHIFRYRKMCKDGTYRWVEASMRGYRDSKSGEVAGYVATVRDISSQKQTEDAWQSERSVLTQQNEHLADLATKDDLTGIPNRRAFNLALEHESARHTRSEKPMALLMIDVDHFKKYNDLYGHVEGDQCLRALAQILQSCAGRASDLTARVGGEEFAVLLPSTDEDGARKIAEDMLLAVRDLDLRHAGRMGWCDQRAARASGRFGAPSRPWRNEARRC